MSKAAKMAQAAVITKDHGEVSFNLVEIAPGFNMVDQVWTVIRPHVSPFEYGQIAFRLIKLAHRLEGGDEAKLNLDTFPTKTDAGEPVQVIAHTDNGGMGVWEITQDGRLMTLSTKPSSSKHHDWINEKYPCREKRIMQRAERRNRRLEQRNRAK